MDSFIKEYFNLLVEIQLFLDTYGVYIDEKTNARYTNLLEGIPIKLSIPEYWENVEVKDINKLKQEIKDVIKSLMFVTWKLQDRTLDEHELEECWSCCKVLLRVRKEETWTKEMFEKTNNKSKIRFKEIRTKLNSPYEEI